MTYNPFNLINKKVLITGASSGIGKATAIECSKMGAQVIITGRNAERLEDTFKNLKGDGHIQIVCDLTITEDRKKLIEKIPYIDGCVNNAGIVKTIPTSFISEDKYNEVLDINTKFPILLTQQLLKTKKITKGASIVFTSSISGNYCGIKGNVLYSVSKSAIEGFVKNAALDLAPKRIRVNSVTPGMIDTDILSDGTIMDDQLKEDLKRYPLKRYGKPIEVAHAIIYLLSDASQWVTGSSLLIDGGYTLR